MYKEDKSLLDQNSESVEEHERLLSQKECLEEAINIVSKMKTVASTR